MISTLSTPFLMGKFCVLRSALNMTISFRIVSRYKKLLHFSGAEHRNQFYKIRHTREYGSKKDLNHHVVGQTAETNKPQTVSFSPTPA